MNFPDALSCPDTREVKQNNLQECGRILDLLSVLVQLRLPEGKQKVVSFHCSTFSIVPETAEFLSSLHLKGTFFLTPEELRKTDRELLKGHETGLLFHGTVSDGGKLLDSRMEMEKITGKLVRTIHLDHTPSAEEKELMEKCGFACGVTPLVFHSLNIPVDPFLFGGTPVGESKELLEKFLSYKPYSVTCGGLFLNIDRLPSPEEAELIGKIPQPDIVNLTTGGLQQYLADALKLDTRVDGTIAENRSGSVLWAVVGEKECKLDPGEFLFAEGEKHDVLRVEKPEETPLPEKPETDQPDGTLFFPGGFRKALTFSYDDACEKDCVFIDILNKYGMKGTFNVNGQVLVHASRSRENWDLRQVYRGHEIATHSLHHSSFAAQTVSALASEIFADRMIVEKLSGRIIFGHAYANGSAQAVKAARELLKANGFLYARGSGTTGKFDLPDDFLLWEQTAHHNGGILEIADRFLAEPENGDLKVCAIWGHVAEFVRDKNFDLADAFCARLAGKEKRIWYAANMEICRYVLAARSLQWSADKTFVRNPGCQTILIACKGKIAALKAGETLYFV